MYEYIILGVIVSIIFYEITEISPGGIVVPGYIAFYLDNYEKVLITIFFSILILIIIEWLSKYIIIYGRRQISIMIILSFIIKKISNPLLGKILFNSFMIVSPIGYIIPALISNDMKKQGVFITVGSLISVSIIIYLLMLISISGWFI